MVKDLGGTRLVSIKVSGKYKLLRIYNYLRYYLIFYIGSQKYDGLLAVVEINQSKYVFEYFPEKFSVRIETVLYDNIADTRGILI